MCFHFCFCFFSWHSCKYYKFCSRIKIGIIIAGIKKYKSIIKIKKKKHDKIALLAKYKLNSIEVLISKALINLSITYDEFVSINNLLKEFYGIEEEIKKSKGLFKNDVTMIRGKGVLKTSDKS